MYRVYIILDVIEGKHGEALHTLRANPDIRLADVLEDTYDVIAVIEASQRKRLAEITVRALASMEDVTSSFKLLPTCEVLVP